MYDGNDLKNGIDYKRDVTGNSFKDISINLYDRFFYSDWFDKKKVQLIRKYRSEVIVCQLFP